MADRKAPNSAPPGGGEKVKVDSFDSDGLKVEDNSFPIAVAVGVGLLTLLIFYLYTRKRRLGRDVLICGICDSGKTTLFSQLISAKLVQTYTSMTHNQMTLQVENKASVELVDVPGHERVRGQVLESFSSTARAILFVVDSNTVSKQIRDVAECLHSILSLQIIAKNSPPVLIICNKQDADLAKGSSAVQSLMEKEIEKVRMTRSSQLAGIEGEEGSLVFIGKQGKAFEFKDLPSEIQFEESSAIDLETLTGVKKWICEKA